MWLAAPRSSPAPHLDGQRALSAGGSQDGVWARAEPVSSRVASMVLSIKGFMMVLPELRLEFGTRSMSDRDFDRQFNLAIRLYCLLWRRATSFTPPQPAFTPPQPAVSLTADEM